MELPELFATGDLTSLAIAAGLVVVGFLLLWLVVRSAVLSALTAHEKRRERDAAAVGPRRGASTAGEQGASSAPAPHAAQAQQAAAAPAGALTPPIGEVHPQPPYVPDAASLPPVTADARQPQPQPSNAAAAAAALFQSRPAAQASAAAAGAITAGAPRAASPQNGVQVPTPPHPQHAMPPQNTVQPQPTPQPGQPIFMSASQPGWAPPPSPAGNPFHVEGEAPRSAPYEPPADPAAPRRF
ncbi:MAG: hypothetical protein EAS51_00460 [Microbacteriaceae bacterium]|nr:MAG: hypothetical protein EAS51_00460 [Microbacteriaceae bacterium]